MRQTRRIAVIGGTGQEGSGLAARFARAGHVVVIGSRDAGKAQDAARRLAEEVGGDCSLHGATNDEAADGAEIVVLAVPYQGQRTTALHLESRLAGKILIDATVPLVPPEVARVALPDGGSAVAALQQELGVGVRIVSAFQNVSWNHLRDLTHDVDCDVLVCADDGEAADLVCELIVEIGLRAFHAGPIANSAAAEAITSVLIAINKRYKISGSGIRITGF